MHRIPGVRFIRHAFALTVCVSLAGYASAAALKSGVAKSPSGPGAAASFDPPFPAASGTPCTVTLFAGDQFADFNAHPFTYTPSCPGPWSRIVFRANFAITPGIQFDRTATVSINDVNIYFGTTREDDPTFGPTWNVTRELTQYAQLFTTTQTGEVDCGNLVNDQYTGVISGSGFLDFYPVTPTAPAPVVADLVLPLNTSGGPAQLSDSSSQLAQTFTLPTNVIRAYLDVVTQSQNEDEFWWSCAPNQFAPTLEDCGNSAFREGEITIDGTLAGIAPVYPWIYTGGIDPNLWLPIPGVQTLNFTPYEVDLTPFAALLSDGQPHTVGLSVFNADNYFSVTGTLLVYEDHGASTVTGATTINTLTEPNPVYGGNVSVDSNGVPVGYVSAGLIRRFTISGYVNSSTGKVTTTINESDQFDNLQTYSDNADTYKQNTSVTTTTTVGSNGNVQVTTSNFTYPLNVGLSLSTGSNGDLDEIISVDQDYFYSSTVQNNGRTTTSVANTAAFDGSDTIDLVTFEDVAQQSSLLNTIVHGNACVQNLVTAQNDQVTSSTSGPCVRE